MPSVHVDLADRSYSISIGTQTLPNMAKTLMGQIDSWTHTVLICDERVFDTLGKQVRDSLQSDAMRISCLILPSGEQHKSAASLTRLWGEMLAERTDRKSVVVAVGGGVVGDLAGFAAATFMRGLRFIQVPTTLLAMVDSSVGGKTGINLPEAKNMIGAFWQPHAVWIDSRCLQSLPDREFRSGLAEVVKYGVILDEAFFEYLETNAPAILARESSCLESIVRRSCELKAQVVAADERETSGLRAILNYGHTFGHAIEATTNYGQFLHGEAISLGMMMAGHLAVRLGMWTEESLLRQRKLLQAFQLPVHRQPARSAELVEAMQLDKKTEHGRLNFVLPTKIGNVKTVAGCSPSDVAESIQAISYV
jgi:3-dehydroquinate synthase